MARRRTIGDNPLDALIPAPETPGTVDPAPAASAPAASAPAASATEALPDEPGALVASAKRRAGGAPGNAAPRATAISPLDPPEGTTAPGQCLTFTLAGEEVAVGILQIREIVEYDALTTVPTTPPWIRGVMNLRGTVVPVVDLALKFGLAETTLTPRTCVVIVEVDLDEEPTLMGVMVDAVVRVIDLSAEDVEEPPAFGTRVRVDYLLAVGKVDDKLVLVLDVDHVLSVDELLAVQDAPEMDEPEMDAPEVDEPVASAEKVPARDEIPNQAEDRRGGEVSEP